MISIFHLLNPQQLSYSQTQPKLILTPPVPLISTFSSTYSSTSSSSYLGTKWFSWLGGIARHVSSSCVYYLLLPPALKLLT